MKMLRETVRSIAAGAIELVRRTGPALGACAITEDRVAMLEAKNEELRKELARLAARYMAEKSGESARLAVIERKMEELGTSLAKLMEKRLQNIDWKREKEVASDETMRRMEPGVSNTHVTKGGQVDWQTVEKRQKNKKTPAEKQPVKITPGSAARTPMKAPERRSENAERRGDKLLLPRTL